ncbi:MAG TPA: TonB family protein, partial [Methylomirabilota bacterium]|nr:TonB family protein [Methylomirabilota bacterium]
MKRRLPVWLGLSLGLHAALALVALSVLAGGGAPMLFIDLVHDLLTPEGPRRAAGGGGGDRTAGGTLVAAPPPRSSPAHPIPPGDAPADAGARPAEPVLPPEPRRVATDPANEPARLPEPVPVPAPLVRAPPEAIQSTGESTMPYAGGTEDIGPPTLVGSRLDAAGRGTGDRASAPDQTGGGTSTTPAVGGPATGNRAVASDGPRGGLGLGAREGSALALAVPGEGGGAGAEYVGYLALLRRRIQESLEYPAVARRRGVTGTVEIEVEVQPSGAIARVTLAASSSHRVLDEAALDAVRAIQRLPFPPEVRPRLLRVRLPVVFDL